METFVALVVFAALVGGIVYLVRKNRTKKSPNSPGVVRGGGGGSRPKTHEK